MTLNRSDAKLQRWIDLLAELLTHRYGLTLEQLCSRIPAYAAGGTRDSVARMFERDKDELRAAGVPIETIEARDADDEPQRYRVDPRDMYLPFLSIAGAAAAASRTGTHDSTQRLRAGYRSIPSLEFEPEELGALVTAAQLALSLEDPAITSDALGALRKLACDFPIDVALGRSPDVIVAPHERAVGATIHQLGQALHRLKCVTFTYRGMTRDVTLPRTVEPYGLFFLRGHWYLAARDQEAGELRNFRVSRMSDVTINVRRPQSQDYRVPDSFQLSEHALDHSAWELGDGDSVEMVVEFRGNSGASRAALRLGTASSGGERFRVFRVRRVDVFSRWILSFVGEAVPISPPALIKACRDTARSTLAVYGETA